MLPFSTWTPVADEMPMFQGAKGEWKGYGRELESWMILVTELRHAGVQLAGLSHRRGKAIQVLVACSRTQHKQPQPVAFGSAHAIKSRLSWDSPLVVGCTAVNL